MDRLGCGNFPLHEKLALDGKTSVNLINVTLAVEWLLSLCYWDVYVQIVEKDIQKSSMKLINFGFHFSSEVLQAMQ